MKMRTNENDSESAKALSRTNCTNKSQFNQNIENKSLALSAKDCQ